MHRHKITMTQYDTDVDSRYENMKKYSCRSSGNDSATDNNNNTVAYLMIFVLPLIVCLPQFIQIYVQYNKEYIDNDAKLDINMFSQTIYNFTETPLINFNSDRLSLNLSYEIFIKLYRQAFFDVYKDDNNIEKIKGEFKIIVNTIYMDGYIVYFGKYYNYLFYINRNKIDKVYCYWNNNKKSDFAKYEKSNYLETMISSNINYKEFRC